MKLVFQTVIAAAILGLAVPAEASTLGITSAGALGAADTFDWSQLGTNSGVLIGPQNVTSTGGVNGTVSSAGNQLQVLQQGTSWTGNFTPGMAVLWDNSAGPDITFTIAKPVQGIGAQIEPDFNGNFTAQITAYGVGGNTLGSFTENGVATSANDGSAIFIGVTDSSADIAKVQFILTDAALDPNDFAIGTLDVSSEGVSPAPLPAGLPLFATALLGLGLYGRRAKKIKI